jgi:hypothetical protein
VSYVVILDVLGKRVILYLPTIMLTKDTTQCNANRRLVIDDEDSTAPDRRGTGRRDRRLGMSLHGGRWEHHAESCSVPDVTGNREFSAHPGDDVVAA